MNNLPTGNDAKCECISTDEPTNAAIQQTLSRRQEECWGSAVSVFEPAIRPALSTQEVIEQQRKACGDPLEFQACMIAMGDAALNKQNMFPARDFFREGNAMHRLVFAGSQWLEEGDSKSASTAYELSEQAISSQQWTTLGNVFLRQGKIIDAGNAYGRAGAVPVDIVQMEADRMVRLGMECVPIDMHVLRNAHMCFCLIQKRIPEDIVLLIGERLLHEHGLSSDRFHQQIQSVGGKLDQDQVKRFADELMQKGAFDRARSWLRVVGEDLPKECLPNLAEECLVKNEIETAMRIYEDLGDKEKCAACIEVMLQRSWDNVNWVWLCAAAERLGINLDNATSVIIPFARRIFEGFPEKGQLEALHEIVDREATAKLWRMSMKILSQFSCVRKVWQEMGDAFVQSGDLSSALTAYGWAEADEKLKTLFPVDNRRHA